MDHTQDTFFENVKSIPPTYGILSHPNSKFLNIGIFQK